MIASTELKTTLAGVGWGAILGACALLAMAGGHGIYFPAAIVSAPFGAVGVIPSLAGAPVLWGAFGALIRTPAIRILLLAHDAGIGIVFWRSPDFWDLSYFSRQPIENQATACAAIGLYILGQCGMIRTISRKRLIAPATR
jgi:hypothetical protein